MTQGCLVRRVLSTDPTAPLSEAGIAVLRMVTGLLVAMLHGWHKLVQGRQYLTAYGGSFDGTPVVTGCSDVDAYVPLGRVRESTGVLIRLGAAVDERIYAGMGHIVNQDEWDAVNAMLRGKVA